VDGNRKPNTAERLKSCEVLLYALVALLVAFPFLEEIARPLILVMPLAGVFVAAVFVVDAGRKAVLRALALAAIQIALTVISLIDREESTSYLIAVALALAATAILILFSTHCVLRYVLRARSITRDQIYAGICMYLMLGFAFGAVFYLITILDPKSFVSGMEKPDLMYFSFVTLATLGYGDISPATSMARSLAVLEALAGMLYIAIFMARLVSMRSDRPDEEPRE
jgi:hypothetical protein